MDEYYVDLVIETHYRVTVNADSPTEAYVAGNLALETTPDDVAPDDVNWYVNWVQQGLFGNRITADEIISKAIRADVSTVR